MDLSIVIPAYNEKQRLPQTLHRLADYLRTQPWQTEIIVVDDGSTDGTAELAADFRDIRIIRRPHQGKGAAVRTGMLAASGRWRLLCDADLSTPIEDITKLDQYRDAADIIIGSRRAAGADVTKNQVAWKVWLGQMGNWVIQLLAVPGIKDTQCGFKLFHEKTASLFQLQRLDGFGYDFELLYLARRAKWRIQEVAVTWRNDDRSRVKPVDYLRTLGELLMIHLNAIRGYYST